MSFSEKLQNLRKEKKYSQEELADLLDVTRQSVSKWESGQTYPEMDKLLSLCKIFSCTLDELTNDDIKEISTEKKIGVKSIIDSFLELVTKTYDMITNMTFKELSRCVFLMLIVACILSLFNHPLNYFQYKLYNLFQSFGSVKVARILSSIIDFFLDVTYVIVTILLFIHIFKIGFLDKYTFVSKIESKKKEEEPKEIIQKEKIVREYKTPNYAFFEALGKLSMFFVKIILFTFAIPLLIMLFMLFGALVVDIYFIFKGIHYFSIPIIIIFSILLDVLVIWFITNIIFNKKNDYKKIVILLLIGIAGLGIGSGIFLLDIHKTEIINEIPKEIKQNNYTYEYSYEEGMFFENWHNIEYNIDNKMKNNINIDINTFEGVNINIDKMSTGYYIDNYVKSGDILKYINIILNGLKENKIYSFDTNSSTIIITSSEDTIKKLKNNLEDYYKREDVYENNYYQREINDLNIQLEKLQERIYSYEEKNNNLTQEKEELEKIIEEYKEKIKNLI